jgi:phosphoglycolate phosphatase
MILIFDFDGTLYDSLDWVWKTIRHQAEFVPQLVKIKTRTDLLKVYNGNFYEEVCKLNKAPKECAPLLSKRMQECFPADYKPQLQPGLKPVLKQLAKQNKIIVVSSNFTGPMVRLLRRDKIAKSIAVVSGADHDPSKTKRVANLLAWLHADPKETYYITDTVGDVKEMKPLGIPVLGVAWGFHSPTALKKAGAKCIIRKPEELLTISNIDALGKPIKMPTKTRKRN